MNIRKNYIIKTIRNTKSFNIITVKKLSIRALEENIINLSDFKDILYHIKQKNGLNLIAGFNILHYRSYRGFNDIYQVI